LSLAPSGGSLAPSEAGMNGKRTWNTAPWPGRPLASMDPPWRSTILRHKASPMPVPVNRSESATRWKGWKIRSPYFSSKPMPSSRTSISQTEPLLAFTLNRTVTRGSSPSR